MSKASPCRLKRRWSDSSKTVSFVSLPVRRPDARGTRKDTYNRVRPHQSLGYLTPAEYLASLGIDV